MLADDARMLALLRRALNDGTAEFHDGQFEAIDALVNRRERLLLVQRTGWGKSFVYFIAARLLRDRDQGPTLLVSPLLALMRNRSMLRVASASRRSPSIRPIQTSGRTSSGRCAKTASTCC